MTYYNFISLSQNLFSITQLSVGSVYGHYRPQFHAIQMKNLPKVKLDKVGIGWNIAQNYSSMLQLVISGHYWPQFT